MVKYKREDFSSQEDFLKYRRLSSMYKMRWLNKREETDEEHREFRILRQRLYGRYYYQCSEKISFAEYLHKYYGVEDIRTISLERLRKVAKSKYKSKS